MDSDEDDVSELLALMEGEEDDKENAETSILEEEYLELERKMKEIKEKMNKKKTNSPTASHSLTKNLNQSPQSKNDEIAAQRQKDISPKTPSTGEQQKSSFLAAFASAPFASADANIPVKKSPPPSNLKRLPERSIIENELPPQKKRRVATGSPTGSNVMPSSAGHAFTESLRNGAPHVPIKKDVDAVSRKPPRSAQNETVIVGSEYFSRIRMRKCFVPNDEMKQRMQGKRFLKLGLIRTTMRISEDTDWVTIGVVCKHMERQTAKNGKPFSIWHLTDLDDCTKTVTFFLFGAVHEKLINQIAVGSVIGLLNPSIMPPKKDETQNSFDNSPALTVDVAERVMHVGLASDLGWCTATKWRNKQPAGKCLAIVNKQVSDVCVFHMKSKYRKTSSKRSELQGSVAAPVAQKYKNTLWNNVKNDQFFYGGKVYSATPSAMAGNTAKPAEPKVKLTKFLQNHSNLATEGRKELLEKAKVMKALSGIEGEHSLSGCSQTFADMLASGDNIAGSRQFLNHLDKAERKKEDLKKSHVKPQTAAEVLKERGNMLKSNKTGSPAAQKENKLSSGSGSLLAQLKMNAAKRKTPSSPSTSFVSSNDIKKMTANIVKAKRLELSKNMAPKLASMRPKLGQGESSNEIDLFGDDWTIPKNAKSQSMSADLAKKKAIAKLRSESGSIFIPKKDPNKGVLQNIENVRNSDSVKSKILKKVEQNCVSLEKRNVQVSNKKASPLGNTKFGNMSKEEFEKILNVKSSFSREIETSEIEEHEKYFNPLIRKEMVEKKMSETFEISCKIVTCAECAYTFWAAHDRCKELRHHLHWKDAKKKFFQCSKCKHRTTTWETYPSKPCKECSSEKNWHRTSMLKEKDVKILDAETLLIRGLEHGKFLSSLQ